MGSLDNDGNRIQQNNNSIRHKGASISENGEVIDNTSTFGTSPDISASQTSIFAGSWSTIRSNSDSDNILRRISQNTQVSLDAGNTSILELIGAAVSGLSPGGGGGFFTDGDGTNAAIGKGVVAPVAGGENSIAQGDGSSAAGNNSFALGKTALADEDFGFAQGYFQTAGKSSFSQGYGWVPTNTIGAQGNYSFAQGGGQAAMGYASFAQGAWYNVASGDQSFAQGKNVKVYTDNTFTQGTNISAFGVKNNFIQGESITIAPSYVGPYYNYGLKNSLIQGSNITAPRMARTLFVQGVNNSVVNSTLSSFSQGANCTIAGTASFVQGESCIASGITAFAIGMNSKAIGNNTFVVGRDANIFRPGQRCWSLNNGISSNSLLNITQLSYSTSGNLYSFGLENGKNYFIRRLDVISRNSHDNSITTFSLPETLTIRRNNGVDISRSGIIQLNRLSALGPLASGMNVVAYIDIDNNMFKIDGDTYGGTGSSAFFFEMEFLQL